MKNEAPKLYSLVNKDDKGHEFVRGNTKYLKHMDQKDLEILFNNGDPRVKVEPDKTASSTPAESSKPAKPATAPATPAL